MLTASLPLAATTASLRRGDVPLREHVANICDRIDEVEPQILALLPEPDRRSRLLREAADLERRYPKPEERPPLYGALLGVKDIYRVDGFATRCGSDLPPETFAGPEATCVQRLKEAGALVLGKTVTTEFAMWEPGPTKNPHDPQHTPGGSSSGSAAAVAAGCAALALGSQTVGSIIRPAAFCGLVGFKPSFDRISTAGIVYVAPSCDHVGLLTQDAAGMSLAASVLVDGWRLERAAAERDRQPAIGVPDGPYLRQADPIALQHFNRQLDRLKDAGCRVERIPTFEDIEAITGYHMVLVWHEFADAHSEWFETYRPLYRHGSAALIERGRMITDGHREEAKNGRLELRDRLHGIMDEHGIDLWASPAATGAAPEGLGSTGDPAMNLPWTHAGLPTATLPAAAAATRLPLGMQLTGRFMADEQLLGWLQGLEPILAG